MTPEHKAEPKSVDDRTPAAWGVRHPDNGMTAREYFTQQAQHTLPSFEESQKEVWSRIHKRETEDYKLPQKMVREIVAEAYWSACYRWLTSVIAANKTTTNQNSPQSSENELVVLRTETIELRRKVRDLEAKLSLANDMNKFIEALKTTPMKNRNNT